MKIPKETYYKIKNECYKLGKIQVYTIYIYILFISLWIIANCQIDRSCGTVARRSGSYHNDDDNHNDNGSATTTTTATVNQPNNQPTQNKTQTKKQTHIQTDKQTNKQTNKQTKQNKQTKKQRNKERKKERKKERNKQINKQTTFTWNLCCQHKESKKTQPSKAKPGKELSFFIWKL